MGRPSTLNRSKGCRGVFTVALALETARDSKLVIRLPYFSRKLARIVEKKVG